MGVYAFEKEIGRRGLRQGFLTECVDVHLEHGILFSGTAEFSRLPLRYTFKTRVPHGEMAGMTVPHKAGRSTGNRGYSRYQQHGKPCDSGRNTQDSPGSRGVVSEDAAKDLQTAQQ